MEFLQRAAFRVVASIFRIWSFGVSLIVDTCEIACIKCHALTSDDNRTFNLTLAFPNGQRREFAVDGTHSTERKRTKLIVDIDLLPDDKYELVSVRNAKKKLKWRPLDKFVETGVYYMLKLIRIVREIIDETDRFLQISIASAECNGTHIDTDDTEIRKKISPRKRVSKSNGRNFQRYVTNVKKILGFGKPEGIVFDPIEGVADVSLNGSFNNSKLKATEKRKQPVDTTSESESTEDDEDDPSSQDANAGEPKTAEEEQKHEVSSTDVTTTANNSVIEADGDLQNSEEIEKTHGDNCAPKKNYFDVDEDYKSAEDPDYDPPQHESSSEESEVEEEPKEKLLQEVEDLKLDRLNEEVQKID